MIRKLLNNKPFYIVLLVIASIILAGSLLIRLAVPEFSTGSVSAPGFSSGQEMPSFDSSEMPSFDSSEMPSFDSSEMPSFDSSEVPSVPDFGSSDSTDTDEATDTGEASAAAEQSYGTVSLLQKIRKAWLFMALPSLAVMVFCIVRLVMISRRRKKEKQEEKDAALKGLDENEILRLRAKEEAELVLAKRSRKKTKNIILAGVLIIVIVFVTVAGRMLTGTTVLSTGKQVDEEILSDSASSSDIQSVIKGAGTVSSDEAVSVTVPGDVTITSWLKANGDTVNAGDAIAAVDTDSAAAAIADLEKLIAELDEDIETAGTDMVSADVTASAGGRVMAIYAAEGDDVAEVMSEYGTMAVLSLDGKLAVDLDVSGSAAVGSDVTVTLSDGSTCTGKVSAKDQKIMTVTVSDETNMAGDTVAVSDADGNTLGTGTLYIHSAQNITGFTGTVKTVEVTEGCTVSAGDTLFTLDDADYSVVRDELLNKRSKLEEQMRELILAYTSGYITADADGILSGIETDDENTGASAVASDMASYSGESAVWSSDGVVYMRDGVSISAVQCEVSQSGESEETKESSTEDKEKDPSENLKEPEASDSENDPAEESSPQEESSEEVSENAEKPSESSQAPEEGQTAQSTEASENEQKPSDQEQMSVPQEEAGGTEADMLKKELIAKIDTLDYETLLKVYQLIREAEQGTGNTGYYQNETGETQPSVNGQDSASGIPSSSGISGSEGTGLPDMSGGSISGSADMGGFDMSSLAEKASESSEEDSDEEEEIDVSKYELSDTTLCSITPDSEMSVDVSVDEKDIAFISEGMTVTVSLDAFPGQSFEGSVSRIDTEDYVNAGGSTKYTVTVVISRSENILTGMNASVIFPKEDRTGVLSIPLNAVSEEGNRVYVYTSYDKKTDTLGDPVEITTGISDGENVEVLSGLSEGETYYYRYAGTIIYNFLSSAGM